MSDKKYPPRDQSPPEEPCDPPDEPNGETPECEELDPGPYPPCLTAPDVPECKEICCCPPKPSSDPTCLDRLIDDQTKLITEAERAKSFKAELEDLLRKAKAAKQDYTREKHKDLLDKWYKQDAAIFDLITKLICAVHCWRCVIECELCPLIKFIRDTELALNGDWRLISPLYSKKDLRYWWERKRDAKKEVFDRIKLVLAAWEKPAQTIEKILTDNAKLIEDTKKILATDSATAVFDVFMKLVPMHLAIGPRKSDGSVDTKITSEYTTFCECDVGEPDDCCGPDVGKWSVRQRLLGPQPYLVDPGKFFGIICCLSQQRYLPAKNHLAAAEAELTKIDGEIKRMNAELEQKKASLFTDFKAGIVIPIECDKYKRKGDGKPNPGYPNKPAQQSAQTER